MGGNWKLISSVRVQIWQRNFMPYQERSFDEASAIRKFAGIGVLNVQTTVLKKINVTLIVYCSICKHSFRLDTFYAVMVFDVALVPWLSHAFWQVILSTPVTVLCLKDPQKGHNTIYTELLTVRVVRWNKLSGCWTLKYKKNSPWTDNKYLLKHNCITIILYIYIYIYIYKEII